MTALNPLTKLTSGPPELPYCESRGKTKTCHYLQIACRQKEIKWDAESLGFKSCLCWRSHIYDGVCLDVVHVWVLETQFLAVAMGSTDDASGDGVLQGEGAPHRHHKLTRTHVGRLAETQHRQGTLQGGDMNQIKLSGRCASRKNYHRAGVDIFIMTCFKGLTQKQRNNIIEMALWSSGNWVVK